MAVNSQKKLTFNVSMKRKIQPDTYGVNALYLGREQTELYGTFGNLIPKAIFTTGSSLSSFFTWTRVLRISI